MLDIMPLLD